MSSFYQVQRSKKQRYLPQLTKTTVWNLLGFLQLYTSSPVSTQFWRLSTPAGTLVSKLYREHANSVHTPGLWGRLQLWASWTGQSLKGNFKVYLAGGTLESQAVLDCTCKPWLVIVDQVCPEDRPIAGPAQVLRRTSQVLLTGTLWVKRYWHRLWKEEIGHLTLIRKTGVYKH
jgi:hypothetical protein